MEERKDTETMGSMHRPLILNTMPVQEKSGVQTPQMQPKNLQATLQVNDHLPSQSTQPYWVSPLLLQCLQANPSWWMTESTLTHVSSKVAEDIVKSMLCRCPTPWVYTWPTHLAASGAWKSERHFWAMIRVRRLGSRCGGRPWHKVFCKRWNVARAGRGGYYSPGIIRLWNAAFGYECRQMSANWLGLFCRSKDK